jgi:hypothetical protein
VANAQIIVDFVANLTGLQKAAGDVEKTGKGASKGLDWKGVAKWVGAAGGLAAAGGFIAGATKKTSDLAKATAGLQRATGLDAKTASEWVLLMQSRGSSADVLAKGLLGLSKAMDTWRAKGEGAASPLKDLGVSFEAVQKGDIGTVLAQVADGLAKIDNPAQKAALASKLFGKAGQTLLPILGKGSEAMQQSLDATNKYGAALDGTALKAVQDQTTAARELKAMQAGLATTIGSAVLPVQAQLFGVLVDMLGVLTPLLQNQDLMTVAVTAGAAAYAAYKVATIASTLAGSKDLVVTVAQVTWKAAVTVATYAQAAAQWVLNAAMIAGTGPVLLVVAAIVALVAIGVLLWRNWDKVSAGMARAFQAIKTAAFAVFSWIRSNWPLLLAILTGPIGVAVLLIQRNWNTIRSTFSSGVSAVMGALRSLGSFVTSAVAAIGATIGKIPDYLEKIVGKVRSAAQSVANAIKSPINAILSAFNGLRFTIPSIPIPKIDLPGGGSIGGGHVGGSTIGGFHVPLLARGGVLTEPTLFVGGESGREIVTPENLLREILAEGHGATYQLNLTTTRADAADVAWGFRRLELLRTGR